MTSEKKTPESAAEFLRERLSEKPSLAIVLGSGLGETAELLEKAITIASEDIPGFPSTGVEGHHGKIVVGYMSGCPVIALQGRVHYYEGHDMERVVFAVRSFAALGIKKMVLTCAAGAVNESYRPGDFMLFRDHINLMGVNPLIGPNYSSGPRFPDLSEAYNSRLREAFRHAALEENVVLREGVYAAMTGPSYETPAEIRMLRILGADCVGMSTVPEVIAGVHAGMETAAIACVTNMAAGIGPGRLSHAEVIEAAGRSAGKFRRLFSNFVRRISAKEQSQ